MAKKKTKKGIFALFTIAALAGGAYAWYKTKKAKDNEVEDSSDIFEEEDFDLDDTL